MDSSLTAEKVYKDLVWQDAGRMSGQLCFYGSRVTVEQFFDSLEAGESLDQFLETFPQVGRERLVEVLKLGFGGVVKEILAA